MRTYAPIVIPVYNRLEDLVNTINSLSNCNNAKEHDVFIFSDAPHPLKYMDDMKVEVVRTYLRELEKNNKFKSITNIFAKEHKGCRKNVSEGINEIINKYGRIIDVEDDLILTVDFLDYMDDALDYFESDKRVMSIAGFAEVGESIQNLNATTFFGKRFHSWGFGLWADRWNLCDFSLSDYPQFKESLEMQDHFSETGYDLPAMYGLECEGHLDSWAVVVAYDQSKRDMLTVYPTRTHVYNVGVNGTHYSGQEIKNDEFDLSAKPYSFEECKSYSEIDKELRSYSQNEADYLAVRGILVPNSMVNKLLKNYQIMNKWMNSRDYGITIDTYFKAKGINTIAFIGYDELADHFIREMEQSKFMVCHLISDLDHAAEQIEDSQMLVISNIMDSYLIKQYLKDKINIPMITIEEIYF